MCASSSSMAMSARCGYRPLRKPPPTFEYSDDPPWFGMTWAIKWASSLLELPWPRRRFQRMRRAPRISGDVAVSQGGGRRRTTGLRPARMHDVIKLEWAAEEKHGA